MILNWNADPIFFNPGFGPGIRWYGLCFALAFLLGYQILSWMFKKEKIDEAKADVLLWGVVLGTLIGARVGHCLFYEPDIYLADPLRILAFWEGGLASHGGTLGIMITIFFLVKRLNLPSYLWILDRLAVPVALGAMLIRIGNFFNSEILGRPTSGDWGIVFQRYDAVPRHPAMLYESFVYLLTFLLLLTLYKRESVRKRQGILIGTMMICIFGARILIEFLKENQEAFEEGMILNMGQLLSIPFVVFGVFLIARQFTGATTRASSRP